MLPAALSHRSFSTFTLLFSATSGHKMQQLSVWVWDRCWSSFWVVFGRKKGHVNYEVYPCHSASHSLIILLSAQAEQKMLCLILSTLFGTKKRWKRMESVLSCFMGITLTSADLWIRRWPMSDHNQMGSQRSLQLSICVFFSDEMPHKAVRRRDAAIVITTPFPLKVNSAIKENTFGTQNCTKRSQSIRNSKLGFFFFCFSSVTSQFGRGLPPSDTIIHQITEQNRTFMAVSHVSISSKALGNWTSSRSQLRLINQRNRCH